MATIESVWDLRPTSSPRSISVFPAPVSSSGSGGNGSGGGGTARTGHHNTGGTTNPFASPSSSDRLGGGGSSSGTNPFDDAAQGNSSSSFVASASSGRKSRTSAAASLRSDSSGGIPSSSADAAAAAAAATSAAISIVVGTERGALHRRTYAGRDAAARGGIGSPIGAGGGVMGGHGTPGDRSGGSRRAEQPLGAGGAGGSSAAASQSDGSSIHALHKPVDMSGAVPGAIVTIVQSQPVSLLNLPPASHSITSAAAANAQPIFYLLVDDNRAAAAAAEGGASKAGAYAAHLITVSGRNGKFEQLMGVPGGDGSNENKTVLSPLSRASCASYHPSCGYVYAAGTSVLSLPPTHALATANHLAGLDEDGKEGGGGSVGGFHSSTSKRGLLSSVPSYRGGHGHGHGHHGAITRRQEQQLAILKAALPSVVFDAKSVLPSIGARSGPDAMCLTCSGRVAVLAVGDGFFAVSGHSVAEDHYLKVTSFGGSASHGHEHHHSDAAAGAAWSSRPDQLGESSTSTRVPPTKVLSFDASGRVHPAVAVEIPVHSSSKAAAPVGDDEVATSLLFLASGRECAAVEILHDPRFIASSSSIGIAYSEEDGSSSFQGPITAGPPRNGVATLASPILAAVGLAGHGSTTSLVAILTSDGLVQTRSPSCLGVPLTTVEVGNRPNDFFTLRLLPNRKIVAASYSGEGRVLALRPESPQDVADRLMTLSIDAFGPANFPRTELAEAISASYGATSYAGHSEPTVAARALLRQYLEAMLGFGDGFGDDVGSGWGSSHADAGGATSQSSAALLTGTALLCKVCSILSRPNTSLATRAARACSTKMGIGVENANTASAKVCQIIADDLLSLALADPSTGMSFVEPASWLLRSCGLHAKAVEVVAGRMNDAESRNKAVGGASGKAGSAAYIKSPMAGWSQLRFESFLSSQLSDLWTSDDNDLADLVLTSGTTVQLLEQNPRLGLSIFTSGHPQSEKQWDSTEALDDPLAHPSNPRRVIDLLKAAKPFIPLQTPSKIETGEKEGAAPLPLTSGRSLAVTYLESAIGISTGRPASATVSTEQDAFDALPPDKAVEERIADLHDELAFLLLEGMLSERREIASTATTTTEEGDATEAKEETDSTDEGEKDSEHGALYRGKLRRFLSWPNAKVRPEQLLKTTPPEFHRERALVLGRLGRHDDALRILYCDLRDLDMALEYCDVRCEQWESKKRRGRFRASTITDDLESDPYLPLVKVALASGDQKEGVDAAIKVLSLRRDVMDCGAALRLLPGDLPVSRIARPFLIPAVVDEESEVRQMKVTAALLRASYVRLKKELTDAQIESQANLRSVPAFKSLGLGELIRTSKPFRARPVHATSSSFPDVTIMKHYFPRYLVIQAKLTNSAVSAISGEGRALADVSFVVAESSDEALTPTLTVPLKTLPTRSTGSVWCALAASPQRLDDIAVIACELRYTVLNVDATTGAPLTFGGGSATVGLGQTYVEELRDLEVRPSDFE